VPPQTLRKDPGRLDRRRVVQVLDDRERPDWEAPRPAAARRVVLRLTRDFDDAEDRLPDGGIENRVFARLDRWRFEDECARISAGTT